MAEESSLWSWVQWPLTACGLGSSAPRRPVAGDRVKYKGGGRFETGVPQRWEEDQVSPGDVGIVQEVDPSQEWPYVCDFCSAVVRLGAGDIEILPPLPEKTLWCMKDSRGKVGVTYEGSRVTETSPGGMAERAGIRPGMRILSIAGKKVAHVTQEVVDAFAAAPRGQAFPVIVAVED
eukprot:Hpha_TRINITY_DN11780_c0_g1::TRINITY_DN11780_c0_g1_i1::g.31989::m.31989